MTALPSKRPEPEYALLLKEELRAKMPTAFFRAFIEPLTVTHSGEQTLELIAPDSSIAAHVESRYRHLIEEALQRLEFRGQMSLRAGFKESKASQRAEQSVLVPAGASPASPQETQGTLPVGFVPCPANRDRIEQLCRGEFKGPVLLVGQEGCGKTLLARALVEQDRAGKRRGLFLTLETYLTEFSLACRKKDTISWRTRLRSHDAIAVDDVHYLKAQALRGQEELRNLIDDCEQQGRPLILCSSVHPQQLSLLPDLLSRLNAIPMIELLYPDQAGREQILEAELSKQGLKLPPAQVSFLAKRISRDMRRLKSAAMRLVGRQSQIQRSLSESELRDLSADLFTHSRSLRPAEILEAVAAFYGMTVDSIRGAARDREYALARHLAAFIALEYGGMTQKEAATMIGRKEHGSVAHARRKIERLMDQDLFFRRQVERMIDGLHHKET